MKSPLRKLRVFGLHHRHDDKERRDHRHTPAKLDELVQASQDMQDMRNCYDSLLSAAASTANSAYEFSEALREMGTCLLEKTALNEDEDSGRVLLMLGKAQFELQKLVDNYRAHIIQTITTPSESLLKELQTVEEMKQQCDDKRDLYKFMSAAHRERGRSRNVKDETFSSQQLQEAQEDYEEEATLFVFRLKSLKQGQSRSLLTQAARHHASQLSFFRKGLKYLEVVEPHIKVIAEQQHIDYQFSGLEDDDTDANDSVYDGNDDAELSFDYGQNDKGQDAPSPPRNLMEVDQGDHIFTQESIIKSAQEDTKSEADLDFSRRPSAVSQSAPLFAENKFDPFEKKKEMRPSSTRKFHTYVLPTPIDVKSSTPTGFRNSISAAPIESKTHIPTQLYHSSPFEPYRFLKEVGGDDSLNPARPVNSKSVLKESNINSGPIRMPPPLAEELSLPQLELRTTDTRKVKRHAFSGPITSKSMSNKPTYTPSVEFPHVGRVPTSRASVSPRVSPSASPPPASSPKINELHELPRPPVGVARRTRPMSLVGHSAPLVSRGQELRITRGVPIVPSHTASPLPTPPAAMARSFSIPSTSKKMPRLEVPHNPDMTEDISSPHLAPMSLKNNHSSSTVSESVYRASKS